jgi:hypothetical protein
MGAVSTLAAVKLKIKGAIRSALESLATSIDSNTTDIEALETAIGSVETLRDEGGMMVYKGTGDALPESPLEGWVFKVNTTSAALGDAPAGAANGDFILYNGTAWEIMVDVG